MMILYSVTSCPDPTGLTTSTGPGDGITTVATYTGPVQYPSVVHWRCRDRRYEVRRAGSGDQTRASLGGQCLWYNNYSVTPAQLECVLTYWSVLT